jgi:TolB protein
MPRLSSTIVVAGLCAFSVAARSAAQDTSKTNEGVRLLLRYDPGTKPGVLVLNIPGDAGDSVRAILQRDFDYSDRINVVAPDGTGFPEAPTAGKTGNYPIYAKLGAVAIVQTTLTPAGVHVAVHDVAQGRVARVKDFALSVKPNSPDWRLAVHAVSDELESWVTGVRGIAATRVAYSQGARVWIVDSDGANPTVESDGGTALSPAWHPKGTHLVYCLVGPRGAQIVLKEFGGSTRVVAGSPGTANLSPIFSPDGNTIVYAHGEENGTDLYAIPMSGGGPAHRITVGRGSDNTSPTFSNDGRRIAFTTGRMGHPEIYISDADGTNAEALTSYTPGDQSYRSDPDWSPDGRLIAYQSLVAGTYQILTIALRDRTNRRLTNEGENDQPSWAPDSRHLVFSSTRGGAKQLIVLDTESGRVRQLTHAAGARTAAWSAPLRSAATSQTP